MAQISVIVPVYKVEKYIHRCADSILEQSFRDIEVILVDDGSPDSCGAICDEYAKKDARVSVIHRENGGLSDARNAGIPYAGGEYIIFLDSDDYIESDMLEYLYRHICESKADMATCGAYEVRETERIVQDQEPEFVCDGAQAYGYILLGTKIRGEIWNKLIKRELIDGIYFPKGKIYEDIYFLADLMPRIKTVAVGTAPKYYYIRREDSITGKPYSSKMMDIMEGYERAYKTVNQHFPSIREQAVCVLIWSKYVVLDKLIFEKDFKAYEEYGKIILYLRKHIGVVMRNRYFTNRRRALALILNISPWLYRKLVLRFF